MVVDASALVAILLNEPDADTLINCLEARSEPVFASPLTIYECVAALVRATGCGISDARASILFLLDEYQITVAEISAAVGEEAITAFDRFGKGRHPAALNMGDCFSYALAKSRRLPLLFKGNDFGRTDIDSAV
ncbi:MAG: type II toxin-antitoxin system VapC family toxin [Rhizobiaceae bacterium]